MEAIINRLWNRWTRRQTRTAAQRRQRLNVEELEERCTPIIAILIGHPAILVNPQPLPPHALVQFDAQPVFPSLIVPGPNTVTDSTFQLNGQFSESGQQQAPGPIGAVPGPSQAWTLAAVYSLQVHVRETLNPPGPTGVPGFLDITYSVDGSADSVLTVDQTGSGAAASSPQEVITIGREDLNSHGEILGTISPVDSAGGQQIAFIANSLAAYETTYRELVRGRMKFQPVTFTRGITRDETFANWMETLHATPGSAALAAIDANFTVNDHLDEALLILAPLHPPQPCIIDAVMSDTGSLQENLNPPGPPIMPAGLSGFVLNGAFHDQGNLDESIDLLATPSFHVANVFAAAGSFNESAVVLPPQPVNLATPMPLAPSGLVFTSTPTLTWTAVAGATHYDVWIEDINTGGVIFAPYVIGNSFTFPLTIGDTYAFSVQALDNAGDASAVSPVMVFTIVQLKVINPTPVSGG